MTPQNIIGDPIFLNTNQVEHIAHNESIFIFSWTSDSFRVNIYVPGFGFGEYYELANNSFDIANIEVPSEVKIKDLMLFNAIKDRSEIVEMYNKTLSMKENGDIFIKDIVEYEDEVVEDINTGTYLDGDVEINSTSVVNSFYEVTDLEITKGSLSLNISSNIIGNPPSIGIEIMIYQTQNMSGKKSGYYEFNKILSISGNTINLENPLENNYYSNIYNNPGGSRVTQIITVPNYNDVILNGEFFGPAWDGMKGGVTIFSF